MSLSGTAAKYLIVNNACGATLPYLDHIWAYIDAELTVGALVASFAAGVFTLTCPPQDMMRIQVGDLARYADESELPMLAQEYHQTLADATAAGVLARMGIQGRAEMLSAKVQADLDRLKTVAAPRTKDTPKHRDGRDS